MRITYRFKVQSHLGQPRWDWTSISKRNESTRYGANRLVNDSWKPNYCPISRHYVEAWCVAHTRIGRTTPTLGFGRFKLYYNFLPLNILNVISATWAPLFIYTSAIEKLMASFKSRNFRFWIDSLDKMSTELIPTLPHRSHRNWSRRPWAAAQSVPTSQQAWVTRASSLPSSAGSRSPEANRPQTGKRCRDSEIRNAHCSP